MTASRSLAEIEKAIQIVEDNLRQLQEQALSKMRRALQRKDMM